jgi:hypothetical protein
MKISICLYLVLFFVQFTVQKGYNYDDDDDDSYYGRSRDTLKIYPSICGCGISDDDSYDVCPGNPLKIYPSICGCGISDVDTDNDGTPDCDDGCPCDSNKVEPDECGCNKSDNADNYQNNNDDEFNNLPLYIYITTCQVIIAILVTIMVMIFLINLF